MFANGFKLSSHSVATFVDIAHAVVDRDISVGREQRQQQQLLRRYQGATRKASRVWRCVGHPPPRFLWSMDRPSSEQMRQRSRELSAALAQTSRELRAAEREQARERSRQARFWQLSGQLLHTVLIVYFLAGCSADPAVTYLRSCGRQRHWPNKSDDELKNMVEDAFLRVDADELAALTDEDDPGDADAMTAALKVVAEWRVFLWASHLNREQGLAPSTEAVLQRYEELRERMPDAARVAYLGTVADARARMWATTYRRRWGGRYGGMRVREAVPLPELENKVVPQIWDLGWIWDQFRDHFWSQFWDRFLVPIFGTALTNSFLAVPKMGTKSWSQNWDQKADPKLGPQNSPGGGGLAMVELFAPGSSQR